MKIRHFIKIKAAKNTTNAKIPKYKVRISRIHFDNPKK